MDGSILSEAKLLEASRDFVCARLVTYENEEEGDFLKSVGGSRILEVANTTFVLLAPDGETPLTRSGRSPRQTFDGSEEQTLNGLLRSMKKIAARYPGVDKPEGAASVPYAVDVRRAINVAACDNQPLVIVSIEDDARREAVESQLAELAWTPDFRGRFAFAKSDSPDELESITAVPKQDGVFVVQPGTYGLDGEVISNANSQNDGELQKMLSLALKAFDKRPMTRQEIRNGKRQGIEWEAEDIEARVDKGGNRGRRGR